MQKTPGPFQKLPSQQTIQRRKLPITQLYEQILVISQRNILDMYIIKWFSALTLHRNFFYLGVPGPPLPRPVLPRERGYMDRVVEYLVGDGPSNRYALICKQCQSHNGMALKEEFEYIGKLVAALALLLYKVSCLVNLPMKI